MNKEILRIIYSDNYTPQKIKFNLHNILNAYLKYLKTRRIFKQKNTLSALQYIEKIVSPKINFCNSDDKIYNARRVIHIIDILDFWHKKPLCLEYSLCLCAALITLGFPLELYIGRALNYVGKYEFHSWLEIDETTINFRINYKELYNIVYHKSF